MLTPDATGLPGAGPFERALAWIPVLLSMLFTAFALLPELRPVPSLNDDALHFLLIQEASSALTRGGDVTDFWSPVLELGFPHFLYYQHLPHLFVVFIDRLLPGRGDLIASFNAVRLVLLVGFPLTVYWSLTRLGFSKQGSTLAAAMAPLFSGNFNYGFGYDSYLWRGLGMYTQLWAMHLSLASLALLAAFLDHGRHRLLTVTAFSVLILSHLLYAYMTAISAVFFLLWGLRPANARVRIARFAVLWAAAALLTAYFWLPFLASKDYLSASPYLEQWKYDSFGAAVILRRLATGALFDHARLPVVTGLVIAGLLAAILGRSRQALLAAALFTLWLALYFGRATWGALTVLLPLHDSLIMHRFIGGVAIAALMLIAVAGTRLWQFTSGMRAWQVPLFTLLAVAIMLPALLERHAFYKHNATLISRAQAALAADRDAKEMLDRMRTLPPGRTFAGLRTDWGKEMKLGDLAFSDLLTFNRIPAVSAPYSSLSLNADLLWHFDYRSRTDYELFNVRHVVAPSRESMPGFLELVERRGKYALYQAAPSSYFAIGRSDIAFFGRPSELLSAARSWMRSGMVAAREFPQVGLGRTVSTPEGIPTYPLADAGRLLPIRAARPSPEGIVTDEIVAPQVYSATVRLDEAATVVLKASYHPNWRATVNGIETPTVMVMPSYVGIRLPPGRHEISVQYRSDETRFLLLRVSAAVIILAAVAATYRVLRGLSAPSSRR